METKVEVVTVRLVVSVLQEIKVGQLLHVGDLRVLRIVLLQAKGLIGTRSSYLRAIKPSVGRIKPIRRCKEVDNVILVLVALSSLVNLVHEVREEENHINGDQLDQHDIGGMQANFVLNYEAIKVNFWAVHRVKVIFIIFKAVVLVEDEEKNVPLEIIIVCICEDSRRDVITKEIKDDQSIIINDFKEIKEREIHNN